MRSHAPSSAGGSPRSARMASPASARRCCVPNWAIMVVHLLFIELRGAGILCVSAWSLLKQVTIRLALSDHKEATYHKTRAACRSIADGLGKTSGEPTSIQGVVNSVNEGVFEYMVSNPWDGDFVSQNGYIVSTFGGLLPKLVWGLFAWVVLVFAFSLWHVLRDGARDYRSGHYIQAVWRLKDSSCMKGFAYSMVAWTLILLIGLLYVSTTEETASDFNPLAEALLSNISGIVLWIFGLTNFCSSGVRPGFKWEHESFMNLVFDRSWKTFHQTSDDFGRHLSKAALIRDDDELSSDSDDPCSQGRCSPGAETRVPVRKLVLHARAEEDIDNVFRSESSRDKAAGRPKSHGKTATLLGGSVPNGKVELPHLTWATVSPDF